MPQQPENPVIYAKMAEVMQAIGGVAKRDKNTHQNFNFRGIDAVMNAVGPVLREKEVIVVPRVLDIEYDKVHTTQNKPATACRVRVEYIFFAEDGSYIACDVAGEAWDSGDKATPKAMSVAFRTALLQALCLPTDEPDPDSHTYEQAPPAKTSTEDVARLSKAFGAAGLGGAENSEGRQIIFKDALDRETKGGDLTTAETDRVLAVLADRTPISPEQEKMLNESLGTTPVETSQEPAEGPRAAATRVGRELHGGGDEPPAEEPS